MKRIFTLLVLFVLLTNFIIAQTTILVENFDDASGFSATPDGFYSDGSGDYFGIYDPVGNTDDFGSGSEPSGISSYTGFSGNYLVGEDLDGDGTAATQVTTWTNINISNYTDLIFEGNFASSGLKKYDGPDFIRVEVSIDGGAYSLILAFEADGDQSNEDLAEDTDFDGQGDGTKLNTTSQIFTKSISGTGNTLTLKVSYHVDSGSEEIAVDDFKISGTLSSSNDSDAYAGDTGSQPTAGTISSTSNDEESEAKDVFSMTLYDDGTSDGADTHVTRIRLKPNSTNTADWTDNIQGVVVDGGTGIISSSSVDITDTYIDINFNSGDLDVADGATKTITLAVYLNTSNIEDGKILSFMVDVDDHGFTADASGTQFKSDFGGGDFYSNDFTIDVEASELRFVQQPSDTEVNQTMSPAVTVEATDENGNRDLDFASDIAITSTGTLSGSPVKSTASSGLATFSSLVHTATGTGLTLNAERDGTGDWDVTSTTFDITPAPAPVCYEEHFDGDVPDGWTNNGTANETTGTHAGAAPNCRALGTGDDIFTPSFDYPEQLEFYQDASSGGNGNTATLEYRIGNSGTWTSLYSFNVTTDGKTETVDLTDVDGVDLSAEQDVFIKFLSSFYTWYLDDVVIRGGSCALGIELVDFKVKKQNSYFKVSWTTSSEINNDYFSLEWSRDGRNFKEIAQIKSKGNNRENQEYGFTHRNPALGTNYYRLTQYDLDGRSETFNIVSVTFDFDKQDMIIAPNKVNNNLIIEFSKPVENGSLLIYDMEGQMIKNSILAKGIDMINLDVSGLPSGQYIVKYLDVKGTATKKFVKI